LPRFYPQVGDKIKQGDRRRIATKQQAAPRREAGQAEAIKDIQKGRDQGDS